MRLRQILHDIKFCIKGLSNFWKFRKLICRYRWWDYGYLLDIIEFILKDYIEYYGKDTHYVGANITRLRACVLLKKFKEYEKETDTIKQEQKLREFFTLLGRNISRFWD